MREVAFFMNIGTMSLWEDTEHHVTEFVSGVGVGEQEFVLHHIAPPVGALRYELLELPDDKAERLVTLFKKLYSAERDVQRFDCLSGLHFICGHDIEWGLSYDTSNPIKPVTDTLLPGEPYIITSEDEVIHGFLGATPNTALHIAGPQGDLAYSSLTDITRVWQGDVRHVHRIFGQGIDLNA